MQCSCERYGTWTSSRWYVLRSPSDLTRGFLFNKHGISYYTKWILFHYYFEWLWKCPFNYGDSVLLSQHDITALGQPSPLYLNMIGCRALWCNTAIIVQLRQNHCLCILLVVFKSWLVWKWYIKNSIWLFVLYSKLSLFYQVNNYITGMELSK